MRYGIEPERLALEARHLASNILLAGLLDDISRAAVVRVMSAATADELTLRTAALELKVIRDLKSRIKHLADMKDSTDDTIG